ncbi:5'-nucleotidase C-terminal domain-containing protein [Arcanobacterium haemolyticum]|nr:5'-nucleotidase C-terminal domain-containing protein [Arcanobacterium haemolyticum]
MPRRITALFAGGVVGLSLVGVPAVAVAADETVGNLTILSTTDTHGHVMNWDYFKDAPYAAGKELGMARVKSIVDAQREANGAESTLVVDNGDANQGTPLTYLAALQPEKFGANAENDPMARVFNLIGYEAQVVGNHEFNYGMEHLRKYEGQLNAPLLGANVLKAGTEEPWLKPYTIIDKKVAGKDVKVGVLGVVTPGVRLWDKANVEGKLQFQDPVAAAKKYVPALKADGADVVVVLIHSGLDNQGYVWNPADLEENVATSLATNVDDVNVIIGGHTHLKTHASEVFTKPDGSSVLFTQPYYWAQSVSKTTLPIDVSGEKPVVKLPEGADAQKALTEALLATDAADSPAITDDPVLKAEHEATLAYVNSKVADSTVEMLTEKSRLEDTPILDLIGKVMTDTVSAGLADTEYGKLPVVAQVSPFSRTARFPQGEVTIKDVAGLYIYDNTLMGMKLTGADMKAYLEYSARYYDPALLNSTGENDKGGGAVDPVTGKTIPDYNLDVLTGVDYAVDITKPVGERIVDLAWPDGTPVADTDEFILAVNNYRANGGGKYPAMGDFSKIVYDEQVEIRQALIDYGTSEGTIDPAKFFDRNWELVQPAMSVSPDTAKTGDEITVAATGLRAEREVVLYAGSEEVARGVTDASGAITLTFAAPVSAQDTLDIELRQGSIALAHQIAVTGAEVVPGDDTPGAGNNATPPADDSTTTDGKVKVKKGKLSYTGTDATAIMAASIAALLVGLTLVARSRKVK